MTELGYHELAETVQVRHAIEYPNFVNTYQASDTEWDKVPHLCPLNT